MIDVQPVILDGRGIRLEPLADEHSEALAAAAADGRLWELWFVALGCKVVGLRTDGFNFRSQRAIEALGAKRDGVIRHYGVRRDGSARDTVMYSILSAEWPDVRRHLELRLHR